MESVVAAGKGVQVSANEPTLATAMDQVKEEQAKRELELNKTPVTRQNITSKNALPRQRPANKKRLPGKKLNALIRRRSNCGNKPCGSDSLNGQLAARQ